MKKMISLVAVCGLGMATMMNPAIAGDKTGGGGEGVAAHYFEVAKRMIGAVKLICRGTENQDPATVKACSYLNPIEASINAMKVEPRSFNTILGRDGQPRDAGNDGDQTTFIDVDRWSGKLYETDKNKIQDARIKQAKLALHEPLVLAGVEANDQYTISDKLIELVTNNHFDFNRLVGTPSRDIVKLKYKLFTEKDSVSYVSARALAEEKAQSEGFEDCKVVREWYTEKPIMFSHAYKRENFVQVKCSAEVK